MICLLGGLLFLQNAFSKNTSNDGPEWPHATTLAPCDLSETETFQFGQGHGRKGMARRDILMSSRLLVEASAAMWTGRCESASRRSTMLCVDGNRLMQTTAVSVFTHTQVVASKIRSPGALAGISAGSSETRSPNME